MHHETIEGPAFTRLTNLASGKLGAKALACSDDFFAEMENLVKPGRGIFIPDKYTDRGKWMDGWESRRKRTPGHDWCILQLATRGVIRGFDIDTNHFLGNHPPHASIEAACVPEGEAIPDLKALDWQEILPKSPLNPGSQHFFEILDQREWTHLRLHIYPDGGVARLKAYGEVRKDWKAVEEDILLDLAAAINGGRAIACNDMFFSSMNNLLMPHKGENMGDGWETKRNRTPGNRDWVIIRLAHRGILEKILVDTAYFKGNYPDKCSLEGLDASDLQDDACTSDQLNWQEILPQSKLEADREHLFSELTHRGPFTHLRMYIYPDGGVSRLRVFGHISR
ncbi:MAG: allantoicase [Bacteroidia bacterium]|nr:allantoicase [Bacteroidia bacterium]